MLLDLTLCHFIWKHPKVQDLLLLYLIYTLSWGRKDEGRGRCCFLVPFLKKFDALSKILAIFIGFFRNFNKERKNYVSKAKNLST